MLRNLNQKCQVFEEILLTYKCRAALKVLLPDYNKFEVELYIILCKLDVNVLKGP